MFCIASAPELIQKLFGTSRLHRWNGYTKGRLHLRDGGTTRKKLRGR
ncbi:hypothetical protein PK52_gp13 [Geobacillus phage vB_GthS_PK5.2]|nr:hypothetical protein PK52_gp13 [Geobacillus phage vB_GthS_PK5.2]